jgi:hypothetical protein
MTAQPQLQPQAEQCHRPRHSQHAAPAPEVGESLAWQVGGGQPLRLASPLHGRWVEASPHLLDRLAEDGVINSGGCINHFTSSRPPSAARVNKKQHVSHSTTAPQEAARVPQYHSTTRRSTCPIVPQYHKKQHVFHSTKVPQETARVPQ